MPRAGRYVHRHPNRKLMVLRDHSSRVPLRGRKGNVGWCHRAITTGGTKDSKPRMKESHRQPSCLTLGQKTQPGREGFVVKSAQKFMSTWDPGITLLGHRVLSDTMI